MGVRERKTHLGLNFISRATLWCLRPTSMRCQLSWQVVRMNCFVTVWGQTIESTARGRHVVKCPLWIVSLLFGLRPRICMFQQKFIMIYKWNGFMKFYVDKVRWIIPLWTVLLLFGLMPRKLYWQQSSFCVTKIRVLWILCWTNWRLGVKTGGPQPGN